ncbi:acyltransferase [Aureimonas endophytica]|uniref:Acyltransferase n=1 Tax=Aureimonas endophytica TaxID=2027858 RepID=A0A917E4N3_9HYPH|nr:acyltransferase [Aureimonas endophytica]GGE01114.1 acyltransferase [Aureimonas endophytica]
MAEARKLKFGVLEIGRGVAASLVVLHHAGNIVAQPRFFDAVPFGGHLENFNVGIDFFFVLSGFIIAWVHWPDIGARARLGRYALKRFLRIYPPYWGVVLPLILLYALFPKAGIPSQHDPLNVVTSILLLPNTVQPVLGVAWTLTHEIFFYAVFGAVIVFGRPALWLLPIWGLAILAASGAGELPFPLSFVLSPFNLEFIMGVGAALLLRRRAMPAPWLLAVGGAGAFLALTLFAVHIQENPLLARLAFGGAAVAFVFGTVEIERRHPLRLAPGLALFGAASYAIYLVHPVALSFLVQIASHTLRLTAVPLEVVVIALAALAGGAGLAYHRLVELPLARLAARIVEATRARCAKACLVTKRLADRS